MIESGSLKISIFTTMPPGVYSGGRYLSLMLAHSLARAGASVTYVSNNAPLFERDFLAFQEQWPIRSIITPDFGLPPDLSSDWVIVIPTGSFDDRFYDAAIRHAEANRARIALINFETPNWYSALSPFPRSPLPTESWRKAVAGGGLVVSIAAEGVEPARQYFGADRDDLAFGYWHPPINDLAAERATAALDAAGEGGSDDRRRISMFVRVEDPHKGAQDLFSLPPRLFDGHILSLVFGRGVSKPYLDAVRRHFASAEQFAVEALAQISDEQKFRLLGRSRLLLFPSYFEGFGYPPVEAAAMGVPTVAYDLPVLGEVAGDAVRRVPIGDTRAFAEEVRAELAKGFSKSPDEVRRLVCGNSDTRSAGEAMLVLLNEAAHLAPANSRSKVVSIPKNSLADTPAVLTHLSRVRSDPRLEDVETTVVCRRLDIRGRISGAKLGDRLQFRMTGTRIPEVILDQPKSDCVEFQASGLIDEWVEEKKGLKGRGRGAGPARLDVRICRPHANSIELGFELVEPDWTTLLLWADGSNRTPAPTAERPPVLIAFRPDLLALDPAVASVASAICDTLDRLGRRTRLLLPVGAPPPKTVAADLELLPRVHEAERLDGESLAAKLHEAHSSGGIVIVGPGCEDAMPASSSPLELIASSKDAGRSMLICAPGLKARSVAVQPSTRSSRRSLADAERKATIVLAPAEPLAGIPQATAQLLKAAELQHDRTDVVVPERLWVRGSNRRFGVEGVVMPMSEAAISSVVTGTGPCVGLIPDEGAPDAASAVLLNDAGHKIINVAEDDAQPPFQAVFAALRSGVAKCPVAKLLAGAVEPARWTMPAGPRGSAPVDLAPTTSGLPILDREGFLSFSSTLGEISNAALIRGWSNRDLYGAQMLGRVAAVAFALEKELVPGTEIELMLRVSSESKVAPPIRFFLNGLEAHPRAKLHLGTSRVCLQTPRGAWKKGDQSHLLVLQYEPEPEKDTDHRVKLLALALSLPSPTISVAESAMHSDPRAPIVRPLTRARAGFSALVRFRAGEASHALIPTIGWSAPEQDFIWSEGNSAALVMSPSPAPKTGVVRFTLDGMTLCRPDRAFQRIGLRVADHPCLRDRIAAGQAGQVEIICSAQALATTLPEFLLLEFPDAISPSKIGMNEDARVLGFALQEGRIEALSRLLAEIPLRAAVGGAATGEASIPCARNAASLRLRGTGPVPLGGFAIAGSTGIYSAFSIGQDSWDVCLPLRGMTAGNIAVAWLSPSGESMAAQPPGELTAEIWADDSWGDAETRVALTVSVRTIPGLPTDYGIGRGTEVQLSREFEPAAELPLCVDTSWGGSESGGLVDGWSHAEDAGTWTNGGQAAIRLPKLGSAAVIVLTGYPFINRECPTQELRFRDQMGEFATVKVTENGVRDLVIVLPTPPIGDLLLDLPNACAPVDVGLSADQRKLAFLLTQMSIFAVGPIRPISRPPLDNGMDDDFRFAGFSKIPDRDESILWLTGKSSVPAQLGIKGQLAWSNPRRLDDGSGWIAGIPIPDAFVSGEPIEICCRHAEGEDVMDIGVISSDELRPLRAAQITERAGVEA